MPHGSVLGAALPLLVGSALLGCSDKTHDVRVEAQEGATLVALITTDLRTPDDIDSLRIERLYPDAEIVLRSDDHELGPTDLRLPAAVYVYPDSDSRARVRVTAWKGATALLVDEAMVDFPKIGSMAFDLRLDRACLGQVNQADGGPVGSSCPQGQTCSRGSCASIDRNGERRAWTGDVDAALAAAPAGDQ